MASFVVAVVVVVFAFERTQLPPIPRMMWGRGGGSKREIKITSVTLLNERLPPVRCLLPSPRDLNRWLLVVVVVSSKSVGRAVNPFSDRGFDCITEVLDLFLPSFRSLFSIRSPRARINEKETPLV